MEHWGFTPEKIIEGDWYDTALLEDNFSISITPARHFSGRGLKRNQTLWASFVLKTPSLNIYIGGDSGYDTHFKNIGKKYGPFDWAILENGQYDKNWKYIHMLPGEQHRAAKDLGAKTIFPVHSGKFTLANHKWDEPLAKITEINSEDIRIVTPKIGQKVDLNSTSQKFENWWETVK